MKQDSAVRKVALTVRSGGSLKEKGPQKRKRRGLIFRVIGKEMVLSLASFRFWGPTIAYFAFLILGSEPILLTSATDIVSLVENATAGGGNLFWLRFCLYVVPYGCCYYDEYACGGAKYRLIRSSPGIYGTAKMFTGGLLTACLVFVANAMFLLVMKLQGTELLLEDDLNGLAQVYPLVESGRTEEIILYLILIQCFAGIFFSILTIMLSAFIRNKFLLLGMPVALFFGLDSFSGLFFNNGYTQPDLTNWRVLFFSLKVNGNANERVAVVRCALYVLVASYIFCRVFVCRVREVAEVG